MKYVTFHKLKIKNFLSIGDDQVVIDINQGLHIITGINRDKEDRRNGVGKSTIADAIYFAIFGNTIREIKKEFIPNNLTNGNCQVELSFNVNSPRGNDEFVIVRSLNPSKLFIHKNGVDKTRDSIANTNQYIEAVLSSTPEIFQNCVIMTVNGTSPFMAKGKVEKRKFIEQIFNLQIFSEMLSNVRDDYNKVTKNLDIESAKFDEIKRSIDLYINQKQSRIKEKEQKINSINSKITANKITIADLNEQLKETENIDTSSKQDEIDRLNAGLDLIEEKIKNLIVSATETATNIKQYNEKLSKVGTSEDVCPTCLRPIDVNDREHFENEKKNIKAKIESFNKDISSYKTDSESLKDKKLKLKNAITKANADLNELKVKLENRNTLQYRIKLLIDVNTQNLESIQNFNTEDNSLDEILNQAKQRFDTTKEEIDNIKKVLNLLDAVKFVVSEEGVKSYIVKKILQNFNSKLAHYLKKLDSNSICIFNEYFEEEILNEKGKICSYNNFSGAERKAIDLACLFSFMDMRKTQGNVHYNLSIYDELLDSSLDEKGVDIVLDILKERSEKYNECVFIISHRKESVKSATGNIIFLEKYNGITKRVNFVE